jgi:hypothetical protein
VTAKKPNSRGAMINTEDPWGKKFLERDKICPRGELAGTKDQTPRAKIKTVTYNKGKSMTAARQPSRKSSAGENKNQQQK